MHPVRVSQVDKVEDDSRQRTAHPKREGRASSELWGMCLRYGPSPCYGSDLTPSSAQVAVDRSAVTRKLAAILIADVVGFSRLMERDDFETFSRLRDIRDRIVDPKIAQNGGRVVKTTGDGMLLEFASADAALRCAVEVQRAMRTENEAKPADDRIEFRIGINLGDIIVDGADIAGDGVNVAARLEGLAEPGGICVSAAVREQVHGSLDVPFEDIGDQQVKNIMRPIRVFAVGLDSSTQSFATQRGRQRSAAARWPLLRQSPSFVWRWSNWIALALAIGTITLFATRWGSPMSVVPEPPAMSVGFLPLVNAIDDSAALQRVASITRDLSAQLTRSDVAIRMVPASSADASSVNFGGLLQIARSLQVRYLLEVQARQADDATEISLLLVDGVTGEQLWSESTVLSTLAGAEQRPRTLRRAMDHLRYRLYELEIKRTNTDSRSTTVRPMDYVLRALDLETAGKSLARFRRQRSLCEQALKLDPDFVPALLCVFYTLDGELDVDSKIDRGAIIEQMDAVTSKAVKLNRNYASAWGARSGALMYMGRWDAAVEAGKAAVQLDADSPTHVAGLAWTMSMVGRPAEAVSLIDLAIAMDPPGGWWTLRAGCEAHLLLGQYEYAITACEKAAGRAGEDFDIAYFLAAAYAHVGSVARAAEELSKIQRSAPGFTIATLRAKRYSTHPEYMRLAELHWYSGLRKAGMAEQ